MNVLKYRAMQNYKHTFIIVLTIVAVLMGYELLRRKVGSFAGSYPFAEKWTIAAPLDSVKNAIVKLKNSDPMLFPAQDVLQFDIDHTGHYSKVDFYYEDSQQIVKTLLRERKSGETTLTLVEFEKSENGELKKMNRDFNYFDNRKEIKKFERLIYDEIIEKLNGSATQSRTKAP